MVMKRILFVVLFFISIFFFIAPKNSLAQGTCDCDPILTDQCIQRLDNCDEGYHPTCASSALCECTCRPDPTTPVTGGVKCAENENGINTAIGCIRVLDSPEAFLSDILKWAVGIGGGIAFLLILYAGFMIMTASGSPERLKAGQELLTSAISGLILLVLSIFVLKFIGIDILGLDQFGFGATP